MFDYHSRKKDARNTMGFDMLSIRTRVMVLLVLIGLQAWVLFYWFKNRFGTSTDTPNADSWVSIWFLAPGIAFFIFSAFIIILFFRREKNGRHHYSSWPTSFILIMSVFCSFIIAIGDQPLWTVSIPFLLLYSAKLSKPTAS